MIEELRAQPPRLIIQDKVATKEVEVQGRIGDRVEILFNMYKKRADGLAKRLAQDMLYYYAMYMKYERLSREQSKLNLPKDRKSL